MYMYVYMSTSSCVYVQCMYTCYYSLPNCSGDEDVFEDASVPTHRTVTITKLLHVYSHTPSKHSFGSNRKR